MLKKNISKSKKYKGTKFHFIIFQTTKKPIKLTVPKILVYGIIPVIIISFVTLLFALYNSNEKNVCLNDKLNNITIKLLAIESQKVETDNENIALKKSLEKKTNQILKSKDELIELHKSIDNIKEKVGIKDDAKVDNNKNITANITPSSSSRAGTIRGVTIPTKESDYDSVALYTSNITSEKSNIEKNNGKLLNDINKLKIEIAELQTDVEDKIEYYQDMPVNFPAYGRITSYFGPRWGRFHRGVDIANNIGSKIYAAGNGTVIESTYNSSYGYYITIQHKYGFRTRYAHLSRRYVTVGEKIKQGDVIALMGNTGLSYGSHLHFEIHYYGQFIDPLTIEEYLK
ncbi:M23 family metallopeptidase [Sedimentibacter sp. zth1]|uniref:M23 family metallopeptidase n=1 Tax=Sedimentibacter sp. zth1 TaxID=2816908 RepID=UPI001A91B490|nr:M23 family metallopeptidase [Sedimentibacter sp. zth1]QSX04691.1 M23 family metallopeptidase [Sedimentibacter sp. zth1]